MGPAERRNEIMRILCRQRYEKMSVLAEKLGVSVRTIGRDISALSISEPIYTQCGKYDGGVYVVDSYSLNRIYMKDNEIEVLCKIHRWVLITKGVLDDSEINILKSIIDEYRKPQGGNVSHKDSKPDKVSI